MEIENLFETFRKDFARETMRNENGNVFFNGEDVRRFIELVIEESSKK